MIGKLIMGLTFFIQATASAPVSHEGLNNDLSPIIRVRVAQQILKIPLESYLMGVLPSEMPASWPLEALKAQVVASRSFVLSQAESRKNFDFDVESTIFDQVFRTENLNYTGKYRDRVVKAIEETRGEVLLEPVKGIAPPKIQKAYFHSDCGGSTESSFFVWRTDEPLMQVRDRDCPLGPNSKWEFRASVKELEDSLKFFGIKSIQVATKTPSGRNGTILLMMKNGEKELLLAETFRRLLGYNKVKSTLFDITIQNEEYVFSGKGHGHGVGMCQWGARMLASQGYNYKKILGHYFPLSRLENAKNIERPLYARK